MQRLLKSLCLGCLAVMVPILASACSEKPQRTGGDASPPGAIGQKDPRWKGIPEEEGDERGIMRKKVYVKPGRSPSGTGK